VRQSHFGYQLIVISVAVNINRRKNRMNVRSSEIAARLRESSGRPSRPRHAGLGSRGKPPQSKGRCACPDPFTPAM